jgi:hypothetical protein
MFTIILTHNALSAASLLNICTTRQSATRSPFCTIKIEDSNERDSSNKACKYSSTIWTMFPGCIILAVSGSHLRLNSWNNKWIILYKFHQLLNKWNTYFIFVFFSNFLSNAKKICSTSVLIGGRNFVKNVV